MNLRACLDRGFGKSSRVGEGLDRPISTIQPASGIDLGFQRAGLFARDRSISTGAPRLAHINASRCKARTPRTDRFVWIRAPPDWIAVHAITLDQLEHEIRRVSDEGQHPLAHLIAKGRNQVVRRSVKSRNDLSACLTGGAPPWRFGLKDRYALAALPRNVQRRGKPRDAAANHDCIGRRSRLEWGEAPDQSALSPTRARRVSSLVHRPGLRSISPRRPYPEPR